MTQKTFGHRKVRDPEHQKIIDDSNACVVWEYQGEDVTRGELSKLFDLVKDAEHWKNPIDKTIDPLSDRDLAVLSYAVIFFAGCSLDVIELPDGRLQCEALGYFQSIGA